MRGHFKGHEKNIVLNDNSKKIEDNIDIRIDVINKILCEFDNLHTRFKEKFEVDYKKFINDKKELEIKFIIEDSKIENFENMIDEFEKEEDIENIATAYLSLDKYGRDEIEKRYFILKFEKDGIIDQLKVKFVKDNRYLKKIELLNNYAFLNNLYINYLPNFIFERMYFIKIVSLPNNINIFDFVYDKEVKIYFDFLEYNDEIQINKFIFWNIEKINYFANKKIMPTENNIYYEYEFSLDKNSNYLLVDEEKEIYGLINEGNYLKVWTTNYGYKLWKMLKINNIKKEVRFSNKIYTGYFKVFNETFLKNLFDSNIIFKEAIENFKIITEKNITGKEEIILEIFFKNNYFAKVDILNYLNQLMEEMFSKMKIKICQKTF
ncbi:hypothetical protein STFE110948_03285 [Streptobacillus felis]|uniref:hypothetical protein n=1 Tax=Streptobacillus felis TaxID=1384509 RepID=UPI0008327B26|nr:hypothetical protein [Streptobacillus felis]